MLSIVRVALHYHTWSPSAINVYSDNPSTVLDDFKVFKDIITLAFVNNRSAMKVKTMVVIVT